MEAKLKTTQLQLADAKSALSTSDVSCLTHALIQEVNDLINGFDKTAETDPVKALQCLASNMDVAKVKIIIDFLDNKKAGGITKDKIKHIAPMMFGFSGEKAIKTKDTVDGIIETMELVITSAYQKADSICDGGFNVGSIKSILNDVYQFKLGQQVASSNTVPMQGVNDIV